MKIPGGKAMSIKRKLTLLMMGISLATVLLTVGPITLYLIYDMRISKVNELHVTAALTGDRNTAALTFLDTARVERNLDIFHQDPAILAACIYDIHGTLFARYEAGKPGQRTECAATAGEIKTFISGTLTSLQEIRSSGQIIGTIFMVSSMDEIHAYVEKILQISSTVALMVLLMTSLMAMYFQRAISGPILQLAATAKLITEKRDYTLAATVAKNDETGVLARAFNNMLGEVRTRDQELMYANETLEHKVLLRTRQLEEAKRSAESANEAKSEFLRNMSHEFRTPLHAIISFAAYGLKDFQSAPPHEIKRYFDIIMKSSERLVKLVNEVLDLARLEHGEQVFTLRQENIFDLLARATEMVKPLCEEKKLTLVSEKTSLQADIVCDHDKIVQVMINLLSNAVKFTPAGKGITVRAGIVEDEGGRYLSVSVIDEGVGIPEYEKDMIFEPFRQSSRTNTGAGGTGLGLAICRGIVEAHEGYIMADNNEKGTGACVTFIIPAGLREGKRLITIHATETQHESAA
jgi:signal transduction histidine kinase